MNRSMPFAQLRHDFHKRGSSSGSATRCPTFFYTEKRLPRLEAKNKLVAGSSDALDKLNLVHERAGLVALGTMNQADLDEAIFKERGWEFIGEAKLYYDELRTNRLGQRVRAFVDKGVARGFISFLL